MPLITKLWDPADHLGDDEAAAAYLDAALEEGDPALIAAALSDIARARGAPELARDIGPSAQDAHARAGVQTKPELATVLKVVRALGLRLTASPTPRPLTRP